MGGGFYKQNHGWIFTIFNKFDRLGDEKEVFKQKIMIGFLPFLANLADDQLVSNFDFNENMLKFTTMRKSITVQISIR